VKMAKAGVEMDAHFFLSKIVIWVSNDEEFHVELESLQKLLKSIFKISFSQNLLELVRKRL